ncbi:WXG100 family type VII secretion target [[Clostridium] fimetarium]|uniref:WXG100 family type VII secretion target n=1 Tax=[Clostridium] fimetarium TaxID=99656 RepID=A0A1I0PFM5_9FIRM|nr:WXG100 family type VII secretion target [[Clostridium] fimetarium]SEW13223.1 WXG100 family type VII secretion target [[Clostridium] fimetarium]
METLKVDLTQLRQTIVVYETATDDLQTSFNELETAMNTLKNSGWKSGASTKYFSTYDTSWKNNMERQLKIINHLKSCLGVAEVEYQTLYNQVNSIGKNL